MRLRRVLEQSLDGRGCDAGFLNSPGCSFIVGKDILGSGAALVT